MNSISFPSTLQNVPIRHIYQNAVMANDLTCPLEHTWDLRLQHSVSKMWPFLVFKAFSRKFINDSHMRQEKQNEPEEESCYHRKQWYHEFKIKIPPISTSCFWKTFPSLPSPVPASSVIHLQLDSFNPHPDSTSDAAVIFLSL